MDLLYEDLNAKLSFFDMVHDCNSGSFAVPAGYNHQLDIFFENEDVQNGCGGPLGSD